MALARRLGLIDAPVDRALSALCRLRNAFAHSAESAYDPSNTDRLAEVVAHARSNTLWAPLDTVLQAQPPSLQGPLDPALRNYILLITILVPFLETAAQQLTPFRPPVVMGFAGILHQE